ncbi:MAG: possible lyase, partial [uncultured Rubrobacteraceae bacterium]
GPDPSLRRGPREGLLHPEGQARGGPRPQGQRRVSGGAAHAPRVGVLDRDRDRDRGHAAGLRPGPPPSRPGHRRGARAAPGAGRRGQRSPALRRPRVETGHGRRLELARLFRRSGRQRLGLAAVARSWV